MNKKIVGALLALTMVLSMGAVAFAADFPETISINDEIANADSVLDTSALVNIHSARWDSWDGDLFIINASLNSGSSATVAVQCDDGTVKTTTISSYSRKEYPIYVGSHVRQVYVHVEMPNGQLAVVGSWGRYN